MSGRSSSRPNPPPTVLIGGYYGYANTGDEAILAAMLQDLRARRADLQVVVVSGDPQSTAATHGVRAVAADDIAALVDAAQTVDAVLLGGGGVFQDYWGCPTESLLTREHGGIPFYAGFPALAALTARPCMIYAAGVGPLQTDAGRELTRAAFEAATVATVRDVESRDLLEAIGVAKVTVTADPAFTLRPNLGRADAILAQLCPQRGTPLVAVCLRRWVPEQLPPDWEEQVAHALDAFIERSGAFVVFVPFQALSRYVLTDDVAATAGVIDRMTNVARVAHLSDRHGPEIVAGVLARCQLVVGMRLHSVVFAATAGVPAVALAYDPKVTSLMTRLGLEEYAMPLDAVAGLGERLSMAWARRDALCATLGARSAELTTLAAGNAALAIGLLEAPGTPAATSRTIEWLSAFALGQARRLAEHQAQADARSAQLSSEVETLSAQTAALAAEIENMKARSAWRLAETARRARGRLAPAGTRRDRAIQMGAWAAVTIAREGLAATLSTVWRNWRLKPRGLWALAYGQAGRASVTLYTDDDGLFPDHRPRRPLSAVATRRLPVSLIATTRNERQSARRWLESVAAQTRMPDEVVIVDGGSSDGTVETLEREAVRLGLDVKIFVEPGVNIARGRNLAIERARGTIIAATDFGGRLTPTWLERIVAPFEDDAALQVVAGWYVALERGRSSPRRWPSLDQVWLDQIDPAEFVPSSRSIAFTREAWAAVGGYPEWLTLTGEDTWFALELRRFCERWAFVRDAVVEWNAPATLREYGRKIYAWSVGDGESGIAAGRYWMAFKRIAGEVAAVAAGAVGIAAAATLGTAVSALLVSAGVGLIAAVALARRWQSLGSLTAVAWEAVGEAALVIGFLRGAARRPRVILRRHRDHRGMIVILSGVPIDDTGGGARCTQLALELAKQGWYVVFVSRFPRQETTSLGLRIRHPRLFTVALHEFPWRRFVRDHARVFRERAVAAIVEFPVAEFLPLARAVREAGGSVVYDLLDHWDGTLGWGWYSPAAERRMIALSDVLIATAPPLAARLARMSGRDVTLLPNAVNPDLFDPRRLWPRPPDYPATAWSMIYIGALWGDWFDWELVRRLAHAYPDSAVVIVGDYPRRMPAVPPNVLLLGLKAQIELPAYLAHAAVAIVPWKSNEITDATSPLKIYEYLAMRRPVVAPQLAGLAGIPGVWLSRDTDEFVRNVSRARGTVLDRAGVDAFVRDNAWSARIETLVELLARVNPRIVAAGTTITNGVEQNDTLGHSGTCSFDRPGQKAPK